MSEAQRISTSDTSTSRFPGDMASFVNQLIACPEGARLTPLSRGLFAIVDAVDYERVSEFRWRSVPRKSGIRYANAEISGRRALMHRVITAAPDGVLVDHINGNGLDNRRSNLRLCTHSENVRNGRAHRDSAVPFRGVSKRGKRFVAHIYIDKRLRYLGAFPTPEAAARAYDAAAIEHFGEFARPNFKTTHEQDSPMKRNATATAIDKHVGAMIRERRILLGMTQDGLAKLLGVTYQQAHKYEKGINRVSAGRLFELARVLSVPVGYFFEGITAAPRPPTPRERATLEMARSYAGLPEREQEAVSALVNALSTGNAANFAKAA